jgi:sporulation protein YlmC with PRC-barrel domain
LLDGETVRFRDVIKIKVFDVEGKHIGHVQDFAMEKDLSAPLISHLAVHILWTDRVGDVELVRRAEDLALLIPWSSVSDVEEDAVRLSQAHPELDYASAANKWLLRRDILDRQMLDAVGTRIQRVDDIILEARGGALAVYGLDVSLLMTSSKLRSYIAGLRRKIKKPAVSPDPDVIPWEAVIRIEEGTVVIGDRVPE